ncbi:MAG: 4Fe-4S dicluster domain-containing protein [Candidatus Hodarchaeales archaeon]
MQDDNNLKDPVLPLGRPTIGSAGETGDWRTSKPVFIQENCIKCYQCWLACPEGTIIVDSHGDYPHVDYVYCKGCGICVKVCPKDALRMEPE